MLHLIRAHEENNSYVPKTPPNARLDIIKPQQDKTNSAACWGLKTGWRHLVDDHILSGLNHHIVRLVMMLLIWSRLWLSSLLGEVPFPTRVLRVLGLLLGLLAFRRCPLLDGLGLRRILARMPFLSDAELFQFLLNRFLRIVPLLLDPALLLFGYDPWFIELHVERRQLPLPS